MIIKMATSKSIRVAVTQHESEWLDLGATVTKTCQLIQEAANHGAQLITFPECWIPGYPAWIWARPVDMELARLYIKNSLSYDSDEIRQICNAAAQNNIAVSLGFSENDGNSVYIAQCTIDKTGEIVMRRRKFKPTHMERTIFGDASGGSLLNVTALDGIGNVGALSCWEHIQPLLKYNTMRQREEFHIAAWPPLHPHPGGEALWGMSSEGCLSLSQTYAVESGTFVFHTTAVMREKGIEKLKTEGGMFGVAGGGCSAIIGPDGRRLSEALPPTEEGIIYADLDMDMLLSSRHFVDAVGHYSRPDMLWLGVDVAEKRHWREDERKP